MLKEEMKIKTTWNNRMKNYYIEKGYVWTKYGDDLYVYPLDLQPNSDVFVYVECDYCGVVYMMQYKKYTQRVINNNHGVNKCACKECLNKKTFDCMMNTHGVINWTQTDEGKKKASEMFKKYDIEFVRNEFEKAGYILITDEYINNRQKLKYICPKHGLKTTTFNHFYNNEKRCAECFYERNSGANNNSWNGGTSYLNHYLRGLLGEWKIESLKRHNYTCYISGEVGGKLEIHHRTPFHIIVDKVLSEYNVKTDKIQIKDIDNELLKLISNKFIEYSMSELGFPLTKHIHKEFHDIYGNKPDVNSFDDYVYRKRNNIGFDDVQKKKFKNKPFKVEHRGKSYEFETQSQLSLVSKDIFGLNITQKKISEILNKGKVLKDNSGNIINMYFI